MGEDTTTGHWRAALKYQVIGCFMTMSKSLNALCDCQRLFTETACCYGLFVRPLTMPGRWLREISHSLHWMPRALCLDFHVQYLDMVTSSRPYGFSICTCHLHAFKPLPSPCAAEHFSCGPALALIAEAFALAADVAAALLLWHFAILAAGERSG